MIAPRRPLKKVIARARQDGITRYHQQALQISTELTAYFRRKHQPMAANISADSVIEALYRVGIRPVLMGTHGLAVWRGQARATQDVDVLVRKKDIRKATKCLHEAFPGLRVEDKAVVVRFVDPGTGEGVIDVMKPLQDVYRLVFRHTISTGETHDIPDLEMALVSKFAAMTSPYRPPGKKMIDGGDFIEIVCHNREAIDMRKLARLADRVYPHGSAEIKALIEDVDAGRTLKL
jgi:hypothetical protein